MPWKLEAYSWGGLTEAPLASASWLLLAPFMMYNVAYFMLPSTVAGGEPEVLDEPVPHLRRDRRHQIAHALLRLLAMAATVQFVTRGRDGDHEHGGLAGGQPQCTCCCRTGWAGTGPGPPDGGLPWPWPRSA